jgi:hypothetical protein
MQGTDHLICMMRVCIFSPEQNNYFSHETNISLFIFGREQKKSIFSPKIFPQFSTKKSDNDFSCAFRVSLFFIV